MGFHWKDLGYASLKDSVDGMYLSEANHLDSFVRSVEKHGWLSISKTKIGQRLPAVTTARTTR
jgi:hypothetical protein